MQLERADESLMQLGVGEDGQDILEENAGGREVRELAQGGAQAYFKTGEFGGAGGMGGGVSGDLGGGIGEGGGLGGHGEKKGRKEGGEDRRRRRIREEDKGGGGMNGIRVEKTRRGVAKGRSSCKDSKSKVKKKNY
jgi:hypothetical protein